MTFAFILDRIVRRAANSKFQLAKLQLNFNYQISVAKTSSKKSIIRLVIEKRNFKQQQGEGWNESHHSSAKFSLLCISIN
jgi:hypothetical protein